MILVIPKIDNPVKRVTINIAITVKTSGWGINRWKPCYFVQTISLSVSGRLRSTVILLIGDNEMALMSIEWVHRVKECTPACSC